MLTTFLSSQNFLVNFCFYSWLCLLPVLSLSIFFVSSPIISVLCLVIVFVGNSCFFMLLDATYMGLIFIIVYVGAIAVLFLFVVMLINLRTLFVPYKRGIHLFFILFTFFFFSDFFLTNLVCLTDIFRFDKLYIFQQSLDLSFRAKYLVDSVALLGYTYYNFFFFYLISLGFLLLIILVGVVVLLAPALVNYISVNRTISNSVLNNRVLDEHRSIVVKY